MSNVPEQAEKALQQGNWSWLTQYLQQILLTGAGGAADQSYALEQTGTQNLGQLLDLAIAVLKAGDFQDRWDVAKLFSAFGNRAIAPLIDLLNDDAAALEARWFAVRSLGSYTQPDVVIALVNLLETTDSEELSSIAAQTLANLGAPAIVALTKFLTSDDTRLVAVRSLAQIRRSDTIEPLLTVVNDPQPTVRAIAIEALGSFHDPRVPPVLIHALFDPAAVVRREAVVGLGMRSDLATSMNLVTQFTDRLHDINLEVCQKAANALGRMRTEDAARSLFHELIAVHTPVPLRIAIVRALGWMETATALDYLQQAWFQLEPSELLYSVHQEIVTMLGRWGEPTFKPQAAQALITILSAAHPVAIDLTVRKAIVTGLGHLAQKQALEPLVQLLAETDNSLKLHVIAALKTLDAHTAHQHLRALESSDNVPHALRQGVAIALQEW